MGRRNQTAPKLQLQHLNGKNESQTKFPKDVPDRPAKTLRCRTARATTFSNQALRCLPRTEKPPQVSSRKLSSAYDSPSHKPPPSIHHFDLLWAAPSPLHQDVGTGHFLGGSAHRTVSFPPPRNLRMKPTSDTDHRTLTAAIVLVSIPGYIIGVPDLYWLMFDSFSVFTIRQLPQIWRIASNFLVTGPKLGMILDPYFVFTYASNLEQTASRFSGPGDFCIYLVFVCSIIVVSSKSLLRILRSFFCTTSYYLPVQYTMTVTVPGNEEDYPLHCAGVRHSQNIKGRLWSVGMVGLCYENNCRP